jgi:uncharacterized protein YbjT (DUF2867 family)
MKVTVFGANGRTGLEVVRAALAAGHSVTAFVRGPAKAPQVDPAARERMRVVIGDALDPSAVATAVADADVVVSALGTAARGTSDVLTRCMVNITEQIALARPGAAIFAVGTVGAGQSAAQLRQPVKALLMAMLSNPIRDHEGAEAALLACPNPGLGVRCVGLTDGPATGRVSASGVDRVQGSRISRADVAGFIVSHLDSTDVPGSIGREGSDHARAVSLW